MYCFNGIEPEGEGGYMFRIKEACEEVDTIVRSPSTCWAYDVWCLAMAKRNTTDNGTMTTCTTYSEALI